MSSVPIIPCLNFVVILMGPYQVWTNLPKLQVCYHSFFSWRNQLFVYSQAAKETSQICNFSWNFHFVYYSIFFQKFFQEIDLFDFTSFFLTLIFTSFYSWNQLFVYFFRRRRRRSWRWHQWDLECQSISCQRKEHYYSK